MPNPSFPTSPLSPAQKRLAKLINDVGYGVIRNLRVEHGQPIFQPAPEAVRNIKFGTKDKHGSHEEISKLRRQQMTELFETLVEIDNGRIESLEVQAGLPFKLTVSCNCQL